ncbi:hypothetical protein GF380_01235 [Candidatus Uhrbacteria bacterium]|nr:hypothetical protein [Candidatus Uhrbacteria bacterium]
MNLYLEQVKNLTNTEVNNKVNFGLAEQQVKGHYPQGKFVPFDAPSYGWRCDTITGHIEAFVWSHVEQIEPIEQDWDFALRHWTTQRYIAWLRQGHLPPPITVIQHVSGTLYSLNRRRWLAAREVGLAWLPTWFSPTNKGGTARWYRTYSV